MAGFILPEDKEITWDGKNLVPLSQGIFSQSVERPNPLEVKDPGKETLQGTVILNYIGYYVALNQPSFAQALTDLISAIPTIPGLFAAGGVKSVVDKIQEKLQKLLEGMTIPLTTRAIITIRKQGDGDLIIRGSAESQGDLRSAGTGVWFKSQVEISEPTGKRPSPSPTTPSNTCYAAPDDGSLPADKTPKEIGSSVAFKVVDTVYFGLTKGSATVTVRNSLEASVKSILPQDQLAKFATDLAERLRGKSLTTGSGADEKMKDPKTQPEADSVQNFLAGVIDALKVVFGVIVEAFKNRVAAASMSATTIVFKAIPEDLLPAGMTKKDLLASSLTDPSTTGGELAVVVQLPKGEVTTRIRLPQDRASVTLDVGGLVRGLLSAPEHLLAADSRDQPAVLNPLSSATSGPRIEVRGRTPDHSITTMETGVPQMTVTLEVSANGDIFDTRQTCHRIEIAATDPSSTNPIFAEMTVEDPVGADACARALAGILSEQIARQNGNRGSMNLFIDGVVLADALRPVPATFPYGKIRLQFSLGLSALLIQVHKTWG